jgi:autotransporter-associated beta strand protein
MKPVTLRLDRLESRLAPAVATWDGAGANANWTTAANWVGNVAPNPGDDLVFPSGAAQLVNVNDFPAGTAFHSFKITGYDYRPTGNAIALAAGFIVDNSGTASSFGATPEINLSLTLTGDQAFANDLGRLTYLLSGSVNLNGHALTVATAPQGAGIVPQNTISGPLTGTGSLTITGGGSLILTGDSTFAGPTTVVGGLSVRGTLPGPVTVAGVPFAGVLSGSETVGDVTVKDVLLSALGGLKTGNLTLGPSS